jgi:hypothetical protein
MRFESFGRNDSLVWVTSGFQYQIEGERKHASFTLNEHPGWQSKCSSKQRWKKHEARRT